MPPKFQAPTGTRDLYPREAAQRRYITEAWRSTSAVHGFEEVDGPTFEHLDLYTVKSGEGIVSELFSFQRFGGEKTYALRPEFTPTLARLFAARANALPRPTKWFSVGPYFRAERPQRGRLREFLQWNADLIGDGSPAADAEIIGVCVGLMERLGLTPAHVRVRTSNRLLIRDLSIHCGLPEEKADAWLGYLDGESKRSDAENTAYLVHRGVPLHVRENFNALLERIKTLKDPSTFSMEDFGIRLDTVDRHREMLTILRSMGILAWCQPPIDLRVVRGLAYYTGMVFEVHEATGAERAVAGGGRYDNLVELFGGPPTPAVGFGMGDVVLTLIMQDKGLMPDEAGVLERAGMRPDVFVISNGVPEAEAQLHPLVASLRAAGLHARHTSKATRNVGKLLKEAGDCRARHAVIIETGQSCTIKDMGTGEQRQLPLDQALGTLTSSR